MTSHQLHALADQIARQERITHSQACAKLARRPRRSKYTAKITVKPAAAYWWQKDNA
jgi:hypothetical protein